VQNRSLEFAEKAEKLEDCIRELVSAGNEIMHALENCSIDPSDPEAAKMLNFHEIAPQLSQEIRDKIQDRYSNFMFTLLVVSRDAVAIDQIMKELSRLRVELSENKFKSTDWMVLRSKFNEYGKKVMLFEELMMELITRYEALAAFQEIKMPSVLTSLPASVRKKLKV
jgi:hypothetical protein